jgi:hypothetical protein
VTISYNGECNAEVSFGCILDSLNGWWVRVSWHNAFLHGSSFYRCIPKPSIPEFTLKYVDNSYDVPATYSTDPYTREKVLVESAHRVDNRTIELWITNQQYAYSNGSTFHVFYLVRTKGHYEEQWVFATPTFDNHLFSFDSDEKGVFIENTPQQSDSTYTVLSFSGVYPPHYPYYTNWTYQSGSQVDFQVQAVIGHESKYFVLSPWLQLQPPYTGYYETGIIFDTTCDWSNTQTITISDSQTPTPSPATTPTPTPSQEPQQTAQTETIIGVAIVVAVLGAGLSLLIYLIKRE